MNNAGSLEKSIYDNISLRSREGQADKKIWRDYKAAAVFIMVIVLILLCVEQYYIDIFHFDDYLYFISFFPLVILLIITIILFREVDIAVNNYLNRKHEFYNLICSALIEKYGYTEDEFKDIKLKINAFQKSNKLKSAYLISFGLYSSFALSIYLFFGILHYNEMVIISIYQDSYYNEIFFPIALFLIIVIYFFFFADPLKKRVEVWYNINNDESKIIDEISSILIKKNIIEQPLILEVKKYFKNPYWLILIAGIITFVGYLITDSNLAAQEKQYIKLVYPIEDKLLEILGY